MQKNAVTALLRGGVLAEAADQVAEVLVPGGLDAGEDPHSRIFSDWKGVAHLVSLLFDVGGTLPGLAWACGRGRAGRARVRPRAAGAADPPGQSQISLQRSKPWPLFSLSDAERQKGQ